MTLRRHVAIMGLVLLASLFSSSAAHASPIFPATMMDELDLDHVPECILCHTSAVGGFGTAQKPFAIYLLSRGLRAADSDSLSNSLLAAEGEQSDVDDDGVTDLDELRDGEDPNSVASSVAPPSYGCALALGPASVSASTNDLTSLLAWVLVALTGWRRQRRSCASLVD